MLKQKKKKTANDIAATVNEQDNIIIAYEKKIRNKQSEYGLPFIFAEKEMELKL
ncbi:hypothetical protein [Gordoniibacillus kamchatkensis]|uniref:hypothetical protein n=1 Tax=Gordoniibacillus kamchatkensis TaxID=1590651 RepID=UPI000B06268C|nr:hypothetical protein [Paenibacillus sp. VKM B-2647]